MRIIKQEEMESQTKDEPKKVINPDELKLRKLGVKIDRIGMRGVRRPRA